MLTAKLLEHEGRQILELPESIRFNDNEIVINKVGDIVILMPKNDEWIGFETGITMFTDDFMSEGRMT